MKRLQPSGPEIEHPVREENKHVKRMHSCMKQIHIRYYLSINDEVDLFQIPNTEHDTQRTLQQREKTCKRRTVQDQH